MSPTHSVHWLKRVLGRVPAAPEILERTQILRRPPAGGYRLRELQANLPAWLDAVASTNSTQSPTRRVLLFGSLPWWIENTSALSLLLAQIGHQVTLAFLPYRHWWTERSRFDVRRQQAYLSGVLSPLSAQITLVDLLSLPASPLNSDLEEDLAKQSLLDVQYTLQREDVSAESEGEAGALVQLRSRRNRSAAARFETLLSEASFDIVVIPNGTILEFGVLHRLARRRDLSVTTYDFGEQRDRVWLAQNREVMRLQTDELWQARGSVPLQPEESEALERLLQARRGARTWATFARQWQSERAGGARRAADKLGLDLSQPVVLLCTNVVGDSLALDRQVFTHGMADWLQATVAHLAQRPQVQLVVRVHPGELLGAGQPSEEIVQQSVPMLPDHVIVVPPEAEINTYDLIDAAHLGLVYTTTVGIEMAALGVPVIVAGDAHYRDKGFASAPNSMAEYLSELDRLLAEPLGRSLPNDTVKRARRYAHRFFFEYPFPYPWHVIRFWDDVRERPFQQVIQPDRLSAYLETLRAIVGEPIDWNRSKVSSQLGAA